MKPLAFNQTEDLAFAQTAKRGGDERQRQT
jgi:hypothetical protein